MKEIILFFLLSTFFCTAPIREYLEPVPKVDNLVDSVETQQELPVPQTLGIQDWPGKRFVVIEKQKIFCEAGYGLYGCREMEKCKDIPDSSRENAAHRIKCEKLSGHILKVDDVSLVDTEWIVIFTDEQTGEMVYGKTHKGAIKEIALESDLEGARKRWLNKTVFSKRGILSTISDNGSGFGSRKVRVQDSLEVVDVSWGITPLPVNPIWLTVQTKKGSLKGIIPVRYSWTNTMSDRVRDWDAWSDDILENDPAIEYSWDETSWDLINSHRIVVDMTREQVVLSWGEPLSRLKKDYQGVSRECWVYGSQELFFGDKGLIGTRELK